jgi:hypothetical protein
MCDPSSAVMLCHKATGRSLGNLPPALLDQMEYNKKFGVYSNKYNCVTYVSHRFILIYTKGLG